MSVNKISKEARPFLKWAGGKTQLIPEIKDALPPAVFNQKFTYIEPFVGSGAILFWMLNNFPNMERAIINDINSDLINTYRVIASSPQKIIIKLKKIQKEYHGLSNDEEKQNDYFKLKKAIYNSRKSDKIVQAALFIFLNKAGFNGIYRVNLKNEYNVPKGSGSTPPICDEENLIAVSNALKKVEILEGDYQQTLKYAKPNTFFYFDPPYKPLTQTSSFNSYTKQKFDDGEQVRLRDFCAKIKENGHSLMLSNSDVKNINEEDSYFDLLYNDFNIKRVQARRSLNAHGDKRGKLNELLITNYNLKNGKQRILVENI